MPPPDGPPGAERRHANRRAAVSRGLTWNTFSEVAQAIISFGGMLVLVRVIPAGEYGKVAAVTGLLAFLSTANAHAFAGQSIQLAEGEDPDWSLHWHAAVVIQLTLFVLANAIAGVYWMVPAYRPLAPMLHVGSVGLLLAAPHILLSEMLTRELDYKRSRLLQAVAALGNTSLAVALGLAGWGAYAIILGAQVAHLLPFSLYLLFIRQWRPADGWFRWPNWRAYRPALRWGTQQVGSAMLGQARGAAEATVLPGAVGFVPLGLLGRAQALHSQTAGRLASIMQNTVYPLLPRAAGDPVVFGRQATLYLRAALLMLLPAATYLGMEGWVASRLLYGQRWIGADPLIRPAVIAAFGAAIFAVASSIVQASGRLRHAFLLNALAAAVGLPLLAVAVMRRDIEAYAWTLAVADTALAGAAMLVAARHFGASWERHALLPPAIATVAAGAALWALRSTFAAAAPFPRLVVGSAGFIAIYVAVLRIAYPEALAMMLARVRGGPRVLRWLRLAGGAP